MAATIAGTPAAINWGNVAVPVGQNVTVESDATAFAMFWSYWDNLVTSPGLLWATLNGVAPAQTEEIARAGNAAASGVCIWYRPETGTKTLQVQWDAPPDAAGGGPNCVVVCLKDGDLRGWRDARTAQGLNATAVSVTLQTESGDLVLKFDSRQGATAPSLSASWTNGQTQANVGGASGRLSYISASGTTQACDSEDEAFSTIVAVAIKPAPASYPVAPSNPADYGAQKRRRRYDGGLTSALDVREW